MPISNMNDIADAIREVAAAKREQTAEPILQTYLIFYGADNLIWLCEAESPQHAVEQFQDAEPEEELNEIMLCQPVSLPS